MIEKINKLHELSFLRRDDIYADFMDQLSTELGKIENNPFIGYVGNRYFKKYPKICYLGKAGGKSSSLSNCDRQMDKKLVKFRDSSVDERLQAFSEYQGEICKFMPKWKFYPIPDHLNSKLNKKIDDIAYVNIIPFRYDFGNKKPSIALYQIAWNAFTNKFLEIIKPDYIIPIGKGVEIQVIKNYSGCKKIITNGISCSINSISFHKDAKKQMKILAKEINKCS